MCDEILTWISTIHWNWELITGASSIVTALCALIFAIRQAKQTERHDRLSVKPYLTAETHDDTINNCHTFELRNNGLGPAIIESFIIKLDNTIIHGVGDEPLVTLLKSLFTNNEQYSSHTACMHKGYALASGEKYLVLKIEFTKPSESHTSFLATLEDRAELEITYKSLYGEKFTFSTKDN